MVAGALAQKAGRGGHAWMLLNHLLGLKRLGFEVTFLDRLIPDASPAPRGGPYGARVPVGSAGARYVDQVMRTVGLENDYAVLLGEGESLGLCLDAVEARLRGCDVLVNVMGFLTDPHLLGLPSRRIFLDLDPGFTQMWKQDGSADLLAGHDAFVTVGQRLGDPGCSIPDAGVTWAKTLPPVVLDGWTPGGTVHRQFSSVATWRGAYAPIFRDGARHGLRVHEFRRFVDLPRLTGSSFTLALDIHPDETADLDLLTTRGWKLEDPVSVAGDPCSYRDFVRTSGAELSVAKEMYVATRSGWFSDRTACYLAAGKPVVAQDTGFSAVLPCEEGLVAFSTCDEAAAGVEEVTARYDHHAMAARELAEACFDSDVVLQALMEVACR